MLDRRKKLILEAIVKYFTDTAIPVGSHALLEDFEVSSATIRSDMSYLEKHGLIYQPHTSAGRIPTEVGYRFFVNELMDSGEDKIRVQKEFELMRRGYYKDKVVSTVYDVVAILSQMTSDVVFATIPENNRTYYMGISNLLKKPEFIKNTPFASQVIEVLEHGFLSVLRDLSLDKNVRIFIGKENIVSQIQSCSMIALQYTCNELDGVIGILGPMRMNYPHNVAVLELAYNMLVED